MKTFWGIKHIHGPISIYNYISQEIVEKKRKYKFIEKLIEPFECENMEEALKHIEKLEK